MKVSIGEDEWWPVYHYSEPKPHHEESRYYTVAHVPQELLDRHDKIEEEFQEVNAELGNYFKRT